MGNFRKLTETYNMKVFTEEGYFFGEINEAILEGSIIKAWKVNSTPGSILSNTVKNARGVIIPQNYFTAFGDIIIVKKINLGGNTDSQIVEPELI